MTDLSNRMKRYENAASLVLPLRTYTVIRVDGRTFRTHLAEAVRPFDDHFVAAMNSVAGALVEEISGSFAAFTQSDECSVVCADFGSLYTEPWFGGNVQKICSVAASIATLRYNSMPQPWRANGTPGGTFDARVYTIASAVEVANYLVWRQLDCSVNSLRMAGTAYFRHEELLGVSSSELQEKLFRRGINWNDYPAGVKRGRVTHRVRDGDKVRWVTEDAPFLRAVPDSFLGELIPPLPDLVSTGK